MKNTTLRVVGSLRRPATQNSGAGLLMTATLVPPLAAVARADPNDRLSDYLDSLRFYLALPDTTVDRILFVDNSCGNLSPLVRLAQETPHAKEVEFIGFEGNDHPYQRGKAYGEFKLMDFGLANTTLFGSDDIVWKTTGRLKFLNLPQMSQRSKSLDFDILCDLHNVPWVGTGNWQTRHNMDLRVFAFRKKAYDTVFRDQWRAHESGFDAGFMYHLVLQKHLDVRVVPRFPVQAQLQGISGRHLRDYRSNSQSFKDSVRGAMRRNVPWLWL